MTATSAQVGQHVDPHAFRRGAVSGVITGLILAAAIVLAFSLGSGLLNPPQQPAAVQTTDYSTWVGPRMPAIQAPAVEPPTVPVVQPPAHPGAQPPGTTYDVHNPFVKGPIRAY